MRVATGKVIAGKIVVDGNPFAEGSTVTILAAEDDETFDLSANEEAALLAAIEEAERGELVEGDQLLREFGHRS